VPERGQDRLVTLNAVNAISAMVAPVVLLTVGGLLSNGLLTVYSSVNDRMREMTRERLEILTGPAGERLELATAPVMSRERLEEINVQLPMMLRRHRLTRQSVLTIYAAIGVLGLSIVVIAIAVSQHDEIAGRVALGLVLGGTVVMLLGIGVAGLSLAKSADAITYAVERTQTIGGLGTRSGGYRVAERRGENPTSSDPDQGSGSEPLTALRVASTTAADGGPAGSGAWVSLTSTLIIDRTE
jgi:hypothetical protein